MNCFDYCNHLRYVINRLLIIFVINTIVNIFIDNVDYYFQDNSEHEFISLIIFHLLLLPQRLFSFLLSLSTLFELSPTLPSLSHFPCFYCSCCCITHIKN